MNYLLNCNMYLLSIVRTPFPLWMYLSSTEAVAGGGRELRCDFSCIKERNIVLSKYWKIFYKGGLVTVLCTFHFSARKRSCFVLKGQPYDIFESKVLDNRNAKPKVANFFKISLGYVMASYNLLSFCREKRWILAVKSSFFDDGGMTGGQCLIV